VLQEFSIEIPDKQADAIHSGMSIRKGYMDCTLMISQSSKQWTTSWLSPTVSRKFTYSLKICTNEECSALNDVGDAVLRSKTDVDLGSRYSRRCYIYASL
jgi:hypothetical protein